MHPELERQYQIHDMKGLLLSPRSRQTENNFVCCSSCCTSLRNSNADNENPPKFAIANGFAIGAIPDEITIVDKDGTTKTITVDPERDLTPVICAAIAPTRPHMYIFAFQGGHSKSITGNFQFFDSDHNKLASALNRVQSTGMQSNIYVVLTGRMTPKQKDIVRQQRELKPTIFLDLLAWFKSVHPGYDNVDMCCPEINLIEDPETEHNTDIESDPDVEKKYNGAVFYFTSPGEPTKETSIYSSTKRLALALLEKRAAPKLVVQGGDYAPHKRVAKLENVMPIQFPFGSGGPDLKRRTAVSEEQILRHYCRLSLRQFMKSDFVLIAKCMLDRHLSYQSALLKCRPMLDSEGTAAGEVIANMTVEDVQNAIEQEETREKILRQGNPAPPIVGTSSAQKFLRAVRTSCRAMGHTPEAAEYARRKCFALQDYSGMHSLFVTTSPDDECSFRVSLYANAATEVSLS